MNTIWVIAATVNLLCSKAGCLGTTVYWTGDARHVEAMIPVGWSVDATKACRVGPRCEQPRGPDAISYDEGLIEIVSTHEAKS